MSKEERRNQQQLKKVEDDDEDGNGNDGHWGMMRALPFDGPPMMMDILDNGQCLGQAFGRGPQGICLNWKSSYF
jgi:hypothetical protein